jgi:hypothetical protein
MSYTNVLTSKGLKYSVANEEMYFAINKNNDNYELELMYFELETFDKGCNIRINDDGDEITVPVFSKLVIDKLSIKKFTITEDNVKYAWVGLY